MSRFHLIGDMLGDTAHPPIRKKARPGPQNSGQVSRPTPRKKPTGGGAAGGGFRSSFSEMIRKKPEVMVKISGFGKRKTGIKGNLDYISREGELALETADGQLIKGKEDIKELATAWAADSSRKRQQQRDTMNLILSMPAGTSREGVLKAARGFAAKTFKENHDYVFVDHRDEKHSHVHLTVRMRGHDGKRLNPRKADLQQWRENFAEALQAQGIEAAATARRARGVVLKPVKQEILHIRERSKAERAAAPPRRGPAETDAVLRIKTLQQGYENALRASPLATATPEQKAADDGQWLRQAQSDWLKTPEGQGALTLRTQLREAKAGKVVVDMQAVDEAFREIRNPSTEPKPWETRIKDRQQQIRSNYLKAAEVLKGSPDRDERELADEIRAFVRDMPPLTTQRHMLRQSIVTQFTKQTAQDRDADQRPR